MSDAHKKAELRPKRIISKQIWHIIRGFCFLGLLYTCNIAPRVNNCYVSIWHWLMKTLPRKMYLYALVRFNNNYAWIRYRFINFDSKIFICFKNDNTQCIDLVKGNFCCSKILHPLYFAYWKCSFLFLIKLN